MKALAASTGNTQQNVPSQQDVLSLLVKVLDDPNQLFAEHLVYF